MYVKRRLELVVLNEGLNFVGGVVKQHNDRYDRAQHAEQDESADENAYPCQRFARLVLSADAVQGYDPIDQCEQTGEKTCRVANETCKRDRHPTAAKEEYRQDAKNKADDGMSVGGRGRVDRGVVFHKFRGTIPLMKEGR